MRAGRYCGAAGAVIVAVGLAALAKEPAGSEAELRRQFVVERRQIESSHAERERRCAEQFIVTSCVEASLAQRREALASLNVREAALDDAERKQRAVERQGRIDAKLARQASASVPQTPLPLVPSESMQGGKRNVSGRTDLATPVEPQRKLAAQPDAAEAKAKEAEAGARFDARAREAKQQQDAAAQRKVQRDRSGKPAAPPLPAIGAASGSR